MFTLCECDSDSSNHNKWVPQDLMEVFTLCHCKNITSPKTVHSLEAKTNRSQKSGLKSCLFVRLGLNLSAITYFAADVTFSTFSRILHLYFFIPTFVSESVQHRLVNDQTIEIQVRFDFFRRVNGLLTTSAGSSSAASP